MATGQVLRELNQVPTSGECPSRPWRARAKSDLQLGGAENLATLPSTCQGALALSGVLRRLQQVEEKVLQVTVLSVCRCPYPNLPAPHPTPSGSLPSGSLPVSVFGLLCVRRQPGSLLPLCLGGNPHGHYHYPSPFSPWLQKRAQNLANREFHTKNIKEKAAHLASMFGHGDLPQVNQGFSASSGTRAGGLTS